MAFRNFFIKTKAEGAQEGEVAPRDVRLVPAAAEVKVVGSMPEPTTEPGDTPSRSAADAAGLVAAAEGSATDLPTGPTHIPHRGPAPFRPVPAESRTMRPQRAEERITFPSRATPGVPMRSTETRPEAPASQSATASTVPAPSGKPAEERRTPSRENKRPAPRIPRHSSGWTAMLKHLKEEPSRRVLDIGPTSPNNINFLTGMGHSVYMADIVTEALSGEWDLSPEREGEAPRFDEARFLARTLDFGDRRFDVVLLWTTIDYLQDGLIPSLIAGLHESMEPGGQLLAFFHTRSQGANTAFCRYHLVDSKEIDVQENEHYPVLHVYTNREIERLFKAYSGYTFFLAKDNVYEVIITR